MSSRLAVPIFREIELIYAKQLVVIDVNALRG